MTDRALQIVRTGEANDFELCSENLEEVVSQIPEGMKVSVVSVVGAFRTGKSFLLNFFLRYLKHGDINDMSDAWMFADGETLSEGNMNANAKANSAKDGDADEDSELPVSKPTESKSFGWRGGQERQTTGIWMWSKPFFRKSSTNPLEKVAILLVDTQGMFDNETTMTVTAQVFGLSTLISSYQIYNVDKRIQEDNLQHLALFSEYGRMALDKPAAVAAADVDNKGADDSNLPTPPKIVQSAAATALNTAKSAKDSVKMHEDLKVGDKEAEGNPMPPPPPQDSSPASSVTAESLKGDDDFIEISNATSRNASSSQNSETMVASEKEELVTMCGSTTKPFQRLQFLVRDWQNFDEDWEEEDEDSDSKQKSMSDEEKALKMERQNKKYMRMRASMDTYLFNVIKDRGMEDLQATREQITRCFSSVDCFLMPHPGFRVTKKTYDGSVKNIEAFFREMLNRYVRIVFDENVEPKLINNRALTGKSLQNFFVVYCKMFQSGGGSFPKAMTMLEATSEGNNRDAFDMAKAVYTHGMDKVAGIGCKFIKEKELVVIHEKLYREAIELFDETATMGAPSAIANYKNKTIDEIKQLKTFYFDANANRNPFKDVELYILPAIIAAISWFLSKVLYAVCGSEAYVCNAAELAFKRIYWIILLCILFFAWKQISGTVEHMKQFLMPLIEAQMQRGKKMHAL